MFTKVSQFCHNYYDQLPADGLKSIGLSALVSLVASVSFFTLCSTQRNRQSDLSHVMLSMGIATLASTIHVLTTPIFNYLFDNPNNNFNGCQELARNFFDLTITYVLINSTTPFKINLITSSIFLTEKFVVLPLYLLKTWFDITARICDRLVNSEVATLTKKIGERLGMDFSKNSSSIYIVV